MGLVAEFTGGDPGITKAVGEVYRNEPTMREKTGLDASIFAYVNRAMASLRDD
jgi:hypothetical protein